MKSSKNLALVIGFFLLFATVMTAWKHRSFQESLKPILKIDRYASVVHEIPFELLPGEKMQTFKVFRVFEDGQREMLEYSIYTDRDSTNENSVIQYSAQGENGAMGDHPIYGETRPLYKFDIGSFAGSNKENRDKFYIKLRNKSVISDGEGIGPVKGIIYLKGRNRYITFPGKPQVPLRWE